MTDSTRLINCSTDVPNNFDRPYHNSRTFQGNLAKALSSSAGFNMETKQSHIVNTLRWYVARLHNRIIRSDQNLHTNYSKVLSQLPHIHRHQSQLKIEDPAEICPLCVVPDNARRGCQRHIMTECRYLIASRRKVLFHPTERALQDLIDSGLISSTSVDVPNLTPYSPDHDLAIEFPNLANLRLLLPCFDQDGFVPTEDNIPTEMYSYCGVIQQTRASKNPMLGK